MTKESVNDNDDSARPATRRQKRDRHNPHHISPSSENSSSPIGPASENTQESVSKTINDGSIFCLGSLKQLLQSGRLDKVGVLELALHGARAKESLTEVNEKIRGHGANTLSVKDCENVCKLPQTNLTRCSCNFETLKDEIRAQTPVWHPFKLAHGERILSWWNEGERHSKGEHLPKQLWESTPTNERALMLALFCPSHASHNT